MRIFSIWVLDLPLRSCQSVTGWHASDMEVCILLLASFVDMILCHGCPLPRPLGVASCNEVWEAESDSGPPPQPRGRKANGVSLSSRSAGNVKAHGRLAWEPIGASSFPESLLLPFRPADAREVGDSIVYIRRGNEGAATHIVSLIDDDPSPINLVLAGPTQPDTRDPNLFTSLPNHNQFVLFLEYPSLRLCIHH
ncbi:uncharacterized protein BCR38DRAFT_83212 [Pseudomassariella vexata]|uniref:Uncharacterized protein n=1 Tax=Pseudomassariella vexata TaxID=1141098 RepID=A0A1Y2DDV9_9PEZI|nr:uncharacterized protein BCR38DRAFT_83212 [Pseudomassariella vexata]ORY57461.1 hypothetical protein BCR38DRAFT_83212 [Pseudomassariella vexata]